MPTNRQHARRLTLALYKIDEVYSLNDKRKSINTSELCLMYALDDGEPHSQSRIAREWLIPKTTLNTIVKQWERNDLLTLEAMPGARREMCIRLTGEGKRHAAAMLAPVYEAEETAICKTLERYPDQFIEAIEYFGSALKKAFEKPEENKEK